MKGELDMPRFSKQVIKEAFQDVFELWDTLVAHEYFTPDELQLLVKVNGLSVKTLNEAIFARYGYRDWEQMKEED
jgi:hypothetical protein